MQWPKPAIRLLYCLILTCFTACSASNIPLATPTPQPIAISTSELVPTPTRSGVEQSNAAATPTAISNASALATPTLLPTLPAFSFGDTAIPELGNPGYDALHYRLELALDPAEVYVHGKTTIELQVTEDNVSTLAFDLVALTVDMVTLNGLPVSFQQTNNKLVVIPHFPLQKSWYATIDVRYQGVPTTEKSLYNHLEPSLGLIWPGDDTIFALSQPDGARMWFPCNDHPADKATFDFEITVPSGMQALANGRPTSIEEGTRFGWEHDAPMAPYLATVVVGEYESITQASGSDVQLTHYVHKNADRAAFMRFIEPLPEMVNWMSAQFGAYPFDSFGLVTVDSVHLSLETQTLSLLSDAAINEDTGEYESRWLIHELAHMWFGDYVTLSSWSEMWRNEGFATYIEILWKTRDNPAALSAEVAALHQIISERQAQEQRSYDLGRIPATRLLKYENYYKGALFIHDLRVQMGDDAFFVGLNRYFERYGGGSASDAQFEAIMEEAAGQSLDEVWARWFANR